ncbi:MAG: hypothetical protein P4M11_15895 [Candidatus Pacebacteria bacterium]|nr:hypothetical protein [Candidatus Paceibacterota bacterium]
MDAKLSLALLMLLICMAPTTLGHKNIPSHVFTCSNDTHSCQPFPVTPKRRPGNRCSSSADCYKTNNACVDGYCRGIPMRATCSESLECDAGLYCGGGHCLKAQTKNQFCNRTIPCASYLLCVNQRCVEYGSMETGSVIVADNSQLDFAAFACKSGYVVNSGNDSICSDGYTLDADAHMSRVCTFNKIECSYHNANSRWVKTTPCICGCSMFQMGYCPPGTGDVEYKRNFGRVVEFSKERRSCHIYYDPRDSTDLPLFCDAARNDYLGYDSYLAFLELNSTTYVRIQDNNMSVRTSENPYYWNYNSARSLGLGPAIPIVIILVLLMCI